MDGINDNDGGVAATIGAVESWNTAPGGSPLNLLIATPGPANLAFGDGQSHLVFDDPFKVCTGFCLAATFTGFYDGNETGTCGGLNVVNIIDSDIVFHKKLPAQLGWTSEEEGGGCAGEFYIEAVVAHEVGHLIGIGHSGNGAALMAPTIGTCDNKLLDIDDTAARDALYACSFSPSVSPVCGDGTCNGSETSCDCPADCPAPPSTETNLCTDGVDNDCDGAIDCNDSDCSGDLACTSSGTGESGGRLCRNGIDDDGDGDVDCDDSECSGAGFCK